MVGRPLISGTERKGRAGWRSRLPDRIWSRFHGFHLFVLKLPIDSTGRAVPTASDEDDTVGRIEIREISDAGDPDLDELVALDGMRKVFAVDAITDNHCYVARLEGKVIAATWSSRKTSCYVKELGREFAILADETYGWGTYCAPEYRGLNVVPRLVAHANADLARRHGKRACLGIVVTSNERMLRAIGKLGGRKVGRVGYLQIGTFRLHYLVGREAFRDTISRIFVERVWI